MNLAKMVVLGTLDKLGPASGYDIFQYLNRTMVFKWADIQKGSVYHALRQLEKEEAIAVLEQTREGRYPEKFIYSVTPLGQKFFDQLQAEAFLTTYPQFFGFKIALKFNNRRTQDEVAYFAEQAIGKIDFCLAEMDTYLESLDKDSEVYQADSFFIEHDRRLFQEEKRWIKEAVRFLYDR